MSLGSDNPRSHSTNPKADRVQGKPEGMLDRDYLLDLISGKYRAQALSTIAALGVPDLLSERALSAREIALHIGGEVPVLERLLIFLVGLGFFHQDSSGLFQLTSLGEQLKTDQLGRLVAFVGSPEQWAPWASLRTTLSTKGNQTPFAATFGQDLYTYLENSPEAAARYDLAIDAFTVEEARELRGAFDFKGRRSLVDVGGGRGMLLKEILRHWPNLRGVLVDRKDVIERAKHDFSKDQAKRIELMGCDFFEQLPQGHDCYCLKHVLHNWDDARATQLLRSCAEAMEPGGRVLVIESILTPDHRMDKARVMDLEMGVLTPGRARRKPEFRRMFREAGLSLESVQAVGSSWLLVGAR